jgi:hypothetical protein
MNSSVSLDQEEEDTGKKKFDPLADIKHLDGNLVNLVRLIEVIF